MTQQQQINLLTSIMPEINETHDPRGVMLKCAEEHNLSPAQLEKLGHVYNTAKTLVGLEKQAHRGDSFSIVDVPEMVAAYTTFDPEKEVAKGSKKVHGVANRLLKCAGEGYWTRKFREFAEGGVEKAAGAKMPGIWEDLLGHDERVVLKNEADGNQWEEIELPGGARLNSVIKSAAASMKYVASQMTKAAEEAREAMVDANETSRRIVGEIKDQLLRSGVKEDMWPEMVQDLDDYFSDRVKTASVAHYIESHLDYDHGCKVPHVDLEKRAEKRMLAQDRHGIFPKAEELVECASAFQEAKALYESLTESFDGGEEMLKLAGDDKGWLETTRQRGNEMSDFIEAATGMKTKDKQEFELNQAMEAAKSQATLQQLMMSDPVIAEADPHEVEDLYNTISSLNSTVAQDPRLMGPVIKEALQYGSVPIQMLRDLVSIDQARQSAINTRYKNEDHAKGEGKR